MIDDEGRKVIWTDGREQRVCVENDYLDDPTGARGKHVVVLLDEEDYEHQFTADEAREIAAALVKASDDVKGASQAAEEMCADPVDPGIDDESPFVMPRAQVVAMAQAMERKLRANDSKGGWKDCDVTWLLGRLADEMGELRRAVGGEGSVLDECVDVANFAMMIADVCGALERKR